jgi:hypothetical protein
MLLPRGDRSTLSALFPDRAAEHLSRAGVALRLGEPALGIAAGGAGWRVALRGSVLEAGAVVLALAPDRAASLLQDAHPVLGPAVETLRALRCAPIATVYLRYAAGMRLRAPFYALLDEPDRDRYGQWVFDRGALDPQLDGILSVVISGQGPHAGLERTALAAAVGRQLSADLGTPAPMAGAVVVERRATLVPAPGLSRPSTRLPAAGLYLAGDGADSPYPSTIEGSVRSGVAAARALLGRVGD